MNPKTSCLIVTLLSLLIFLPQARANTVGTEYQNFSPTYSGLDFTTVESSETIKPCMCSLSVFINYAKNTLTYSDSYYNSGVTTNIKGKRANDYMVGADVMLGMGITSNLDFGLILPFVVTARNDDPYGVSYFDKFGLTEIRPMVKWRFIGDDHGGWAVGLSANVNTIENNPFSGKDPGPTINLQLIGDTTTKGGTKLGMNVGYRKRDSGDRISDPSSGDIPPFVPFKDSWIFSLAVAEKFQSINSDVVFELVGNHSGKINESDSARQAQQALELNLGIRNESYQSLPIHAGLGTKFFNAQASPDVRVYAGFNYNFGPVCNATTDYPVAVVSNVPTGTSPVTQLSMSVSADNMVGYRWKIGSTPRVNCNVETDYSDEIPGDLVISTNIGHIPDGGITLCALAKNDKGIWQPLSRPTVYRWTKAKPGSGPIAVVSNHPVGQSEVTELDMPVSAIDPSDYAAYRWKIGSTNSMNCQQPTGYSSEVPADQPILVTIKDLPDGGITLCALAKNHGGQWQPYNRPTIIRWVKVTSVAQMKPVNDVKKDGYELFRLSAEVLFDFDKHNIRNTAQDDLDRINRYLRLKPYKRVVIEGHTDGKGSDAYNMALSKRRAVAVKNWLVQKYGLPAAKFNPVGKGKRFPVATNNTDEGRQKNRRVEFKIYR